MEEKTILSTRLLPLVEQHECSDKLLNILKLYQFGTNEGTVGWFLNSNPPAATYLLSGPYFTNSLIAELRSIISKAIFNAELSASNEMSEPKVSLSKDRVEKLHTEQPDKPIDLTIPEFLRRTTQPIFSKLELDQNNISYSAYIERKKRELSLKRMSSKYPIAKDI